MVKQLTGKDFCNSDCLDRNNNIYPITITEAIKYNDSIDVTLYDYLQLNEGDRIYNNLLEWLQINYPTGEYSLPVATDTILGGIKVGDYLSITTDGILSVDKNSLNIPILPTAATYNQQGIISLGNDSVLSSVFGNGTMSHETVVPYTTSENQVYAFPLRLDNRGHAGISIPVELFQPSQVQPDWNQNSTAATSYIKNKPVLSAIATTGNYTDLNNVPNFATKTWVQSNYYDTLHINSNYYTSAEIDNLITSIMHYKGSVVSKTSLPTEGNVIGDVYNVISTGANYAWDGTDWDELGSSVDLSNYYTKDQVNNLIPTVNNGTLNIKQNGVSIGTFTANQTNNTTIEITTTSTTYTAGNNVDITNNVISAVDTTYNAATENNLGLIKIGYTETDNKRAVRLDENNQAYIQTITPTAAFITNGFSQHYFEVTKTGYVPIMKITQHTQTTNIAFRVNQHFRIYSRHLRHFYGEYYINYKDANHSDIKSSAALGLINVSVKSDTYTPSGGVETNYLNNQSIRFVVTNYEMIVYLYIPELSEVGTDKKMCFMTSILGCNDEGVDEGMLNDYEYYCTTKYSNNEIVITSDNIKQAEDLTFLAPTIIE